jgi:COP9 signalosome complex subunit 3
MAIVPISSAILRLDPEGSTFTSNHLLLARLALESNRGGLATAVLDRPILYFPGGTAHSQLQYLCSSDSIAANYITAESGLTSKIKSSDILEYFTLTGSIYIGLRKWSKALEALETAISYPNKDSSVSKIMVEAYKKWILVNLLLHGKSGILPSMTSSGAARSYHTLAKPYETIASLFDSAPASRLKQEADVGVDIWKMDGNTGLILHVLSAYQKFQIRNLANIYSSLSLAEINGLTVSAETGKPLTSTEAVEELVLSMISDGSLHATLIQDSDAPPVLTFNSTGPILSELEVQVQLAQSMLRLKSLADDVKSTDRRLTQEKEYLKWALKQKKTSQSHGAGGTPGAESGWINSHMGMVHDDDDDDDDEDLMGSGY